MCSIGAAVRICSQGAAAPCALANAAQCAPGKHLHAPYAPVELLYVLPESSCSIIHNALCSLALCYYYYVETREKRYASYQQ